MPKPCETAARKLPKRCFWNLLKTKKKGCERLPQARQTFAQRKTWKPASHQAKRKKKVFGACMRQGRTPAGLAPKPLPNRSRKNAETSLLEPIKKKEKIVPKPCETAARKLPKRCFWNLLLKTKKKPASHQASVQSLWPTASETAEQQQDSCPNHAKQRPRTMPKRCLRNALGAEWASKTFSGPLWNVKHQKPCETATTNNAETLPTKRIKRRMSFQNLWRTAMKCQTSKLASQAFGGPLVQPPNSSRIRA